MSTVLLPFLHSQMVFAGKVEVSVRNVYILNRRYSINGDIASDIYIYFSKYIIIGNVFILMREEIKITIITDLIIKVRRVLIF